MNRTIFNLLVALLVLLVSAISLVGALWLLRRRRNASKIDTELPLYNKTPLSSSFASHFSNHRRNTRRPSASIHIYQEKQNLIDNSDSPPASPVPEIRVTFPDETDDSGKRQSGRVVVVRVGENNHIGLEPVDEDLPSYQKSDSDRFQSLDLDRIGGLTEKESHTPKWG